MILVIIDIMANILQWNARGVISKWAEIKQVLVDGNFQVICLQETHFIANDRYSFNLPRFTSYNAYSAQGDRRGGVSIYVTNNLPHMQLPLQSSLQAVACSVRLMNRRVAFCSLYLPPSETFSFLDLSHLFTQLPKPFILCTDANSKHHLWGARHSDNRGRIWMDVINHHHLHVLNDGRPTRMDESTGELSHIDLTVVSHDVAHLLDWNTERDLHSSDHFPLHVQFYSPDPVPDLPPLFAGWNVRKANWIEFQQGTDFLFNPELGLENCDIITKDIIEKACMYIPVRNGNTKYQCPWWSVECREAIRDRKRAQNRSRRNPHSLFLRIEYRKAKARTRRILRQAQLTSWHELLSMFNHRTPMTRLWDILRKFSNKTRTVRPFPVLMHNNNTIDEPNEVANIFGRFFADLCSSSNYPPSFLEHERELADNLPDFDSENQEVYNKVFSMRELTDAVARSGSTSVGPDQIHYDFFRHMSEPQLQAILDLYNYLWTSDQFPEAWRHSYIIPILKMGKDCNQVQSYRPIQLTSCLCKLFERMIAKRLSWCLEKYEVLSEYQCAFRPGKSTVDHLIRLDSHIREGFLHHSNTLAVFLDIKSAYNLVSPTVLLSRMHRIGFRGHIMHFIRGYLQHRTFQVRCGVLSEVFEQEYGIVQGGVISPILFNIAIDSIVDVIPRGVSIAIYADDCTLWVQGMNIAMLYQKLQRALNRVGDWSALHGFTFSPTKSNAILFRRGLRHVDLGHLPILKLNNVQIPLVAQVKYLGVILDSKLNLAAHMDYTKARAQKRLSILKSISGKSYGADRTILLRLYKSMIRPILEYSCHIIDGPGSRRVESLEVIQNASLRIATGALRTSPVRALQVDTNVVPLGIRRKELLLRYFLKVKGDSHHPCHHLMMLEDYAELYRDLSEQYLRRISGFPISYRLRIIFQETGYHPPEQMAHRGGLLAPWVLRDVSVIMLSTQDKRHMTDADVQTAFIELTHKFPGFRLLFTDGSKQNTSVACAFTMNSVYSSFKLENGLSVYTAELVAIREALKYVGRNRIPKALICSDSQSAIRAMSAKSRDHPVLIEILEIYHRNAQDGIECIMVWIPGHQGIAGNVRADLLAKKAHERTDVLVISVGHREFVSAVRKHVYDLFSKLWQEYRPTQLKQIKPLTGCWVSCVRKSRREEVILCRLRLGHTRLTHSHVIDHDPPPMCDICRCRLDVPHIILQCRKFTAARRCLSRVSRDAGVALSLAFLLGNNDTVIIDALFHYLRQCDLYDEL